MLSGGFRFAQPTLRSERKKEAERRQTCISTSASCDAARCNGRRARLSAFHRGSRLRRLERHWLSFRHALPGTRSGRRSQSFEQPGESDTVFAGVTRSLPVPVQRAPRRPVVMPAGRVPEAARVRSVSFRARAPHSLRLLEYLRDRRPGSSRFVDPIPEIETNVNGRVTARHQPKPPCALAQANSPIER